MQAKKMRMKYGKLFIFFMICFNLIVFYYSWKYFLTSGHYLAETLAGSAGGARAGHSVLRRSGAAPESIPLVSYESSYRIGDPATLNRLRLHRPTEPDVAGDGDHRANPSRDRVQLTNGYLRKSITFVFRDFYDFDNDLLQSIGSVTSLIPNVNVFVIAPELPYPPLDIFNVASASGGSGQRTANQSAPKLGAGWFEKGSNVRFFSLAYDVTKSLRDTFPILHVRTRYVLFMPDSVRLTGRGLLSRMLREIDTPSGDEILLQQHQHLLLKQNAYRLRGEQHRPAFHQRQPAPPVRQQDPHLVAPFDANRKPERRIVAVPFGVSPNAKPGASCVQIQLDLPNWTLEYVTGNETDNCDMFKQKHAILVETELLKDMPDALSSPFPDVFYIQAKLAGVKKVLLNGAFQDGRKLFTSYHTKTKRRNVRKDQFKALYRRLQVKKVIRKSYLYDKSGRGQLSAGGAGLGLPPPAPRRKYVKSYEHNNQTISLLTEITFYGCEKQTKSCIGQVHNGRPFYRHLGRHTPPCCMEKLKAVFRHVVDEFENVGIRYWLDNHALRDALERKGLAEDAYEIDLSFNSDDVQRSLALRKAQTKPYTDEAGFHWLKATDGHYFRVQFSKMNQIAVNLLPFDLSSGELVRPNGFYGWKARKFSVEFLHPMSTVLFLGKPIMCPNNVIEYLEVKNVK